MEMREMVVGTSASSPKRSQAKPFFISVITMTLIKRLKAIGNFRAGN